MLATQNKKLLNESEIRSEFITPALKSKGWCLGTTYREEYPITQGQIIAGKNLKRNLPLHADYVLFRRPNIPLAVVEAKDNKHNIADGMQQALKYARMLEVPFVFIIN